MPWEEKSRGGVLILTQIGAITKNKCQDVFVRVIHEMKKRGHSVIGMMMSTHLYHVSTHTVSHAPLQTVHEAPLLAVRNYSLLRFLLHTHYHKPHLVD